MVTLSLFPQTFYLIDCSSIIAFSGADYAKPNQYIEYREDIWTYLEKMIDVGSLKTVPQFWEEIKYNDESSYYRLHNRRDKFTVDLDNNIYPMLASLLFTYPSLLARKSGYTREPCDPFLIVYAQQWKTPIITDEKRLTERVGKNQKKQLKIPDVCDRENLSCVCLEKYLKDQGVIPSDYIP